MSVTYQNAPLVELIAEVRWGAPAFQMPMGTPMMSVGVPPGLADEELYVQYGALASQRGFGRVERLVPGGFPVAPHQAVYRYRPTDPNLASPLFQLGNGVFTTNATPPYKSWVDFSPKVLEGLQLLEAAFQNVKRPMPQFHSVLLRYINAFKEDLTRGLSPIKFWSDVLGFKLELPDALMDQCTDVTKLAGNIQLALPVKPGQLSLVLSHGTAENQPAVIFDLTVLISRSIDPSGAAALDALTQARNVIHQVFRGVTAKLHQLMGPA